jgi:hypothetical protein
MARRPAVLLSRARARGEPPSTPSPRLVPSSNSVPSRPLLPDAGPPVAQRCPRRARAPVNNRHLVLILQGRRRQPVSTARSICDRQLTASTTSVG